MVEWCEDCEDRPEVAWSGGKDRGIARGDTGNEQVGSCMGMTANELGEKLVICRIVLCSSGLVGDKKQGHCGMEACKS